MNPNWKKKINAIAKQVKGETNRITSQEWNFIINSLAEQTNNNTAGVSESFYLIEKLEDFVKKLTNGEVSFNAIVLNGKNLEDRIVLIETNNENFEQEIKHYIDSKNSLQDQEIILKASIEYVDGKVFAINQNILTLSEYVDQKIEDSVADLESKYNFIRFSDGMGEFNIDTDCNDRTIYINIDNFGLGTFPSDYSDGGFLIQTRRGGDENYVQTLFSPVNGKMYTREELGYDEADNPLWGEWKDYHGERSAFVQYQSSSGWAKIAQIRLPANNSQRESITFLVTTEDNTSTTAERYTGILELNTHENAASSSLKWLVVSGFGLSNFNLRVNGNRLEVWVLPTVGTMSFAVLSETMSGEDVRFIELFDVSEPATRTGTSLGNSEKLTIMTNAEIKAAYEANTDTNAYTDEDKQNVEKIPTIEQDIVDLENEVDDIKDNYVTNIALNLQLLEKQSIRPNGTDLLVIDGKINSVYVDSLYATDIETVNTVAEMLALPNMKRGDIAIVVETESTYILKQEPSNVLGNWAKFLSKPEVISVNGKTGIVHIGISDIDNLQDILNGKLNVTTYENDKGILEQSIEDLENNKVDKVAGKGLSDENFTLLEKNKLANLKQVVPDEETIVFNDNDELEATNVSIWRYE